LELVVEGEEMKAKENGNRDSGEGGGGGGGWGAEGGVVPLRYLGIEMEALASVLS
jgi:hypothetical protein